MGFNNVPVNGWPQIKDLEKLDAIAQQIQNMPTFTSNDKAFLEELPAFPSEDGKKALVATTSSGNTNLNYEELSDLPADPETDGVRVLTATTTNGETTLSYEEGGGAKEVETLTPETGVIINSQTVCKCGYIVNANLSITKTLVLNTDNLIAILPTALRPDHNVYIAGYNSSKGCLITCFIDATTGGVYIYPIAATADASSQNITFNFVYTV